MPDLPPAGEPTRAATDSVRSIADRYVEDLGRFDPVEAVRNGTGLAGVTLTDYSPEGRSARLEWLREVQSSLRQNPPVDEAERLGARYLLEECTGQIELLEAREADLLPSALAGPPASVRMVFDLMDRSTPASWEPVLARLQAVPDAMAGYRRSLEVAAAEGPGVSRRLVLSLAEQCRTWAGSGGAAGERSWFEQYVDGAGADAATARALPVAARAAGRAYGELAEWLERAGAALARDVDGVGVERYGRWARTMLGSSLDLDDAYAWGIEEWRRIDDERVAECRRWRPDASWDEVLTELAEPRRSLDGVDAYRGWLQELTDAAVDGLDGVEFDIPAPLRRCVVSIPPEGSAAAPYYTAPSEDLSHPGRTWWPTLGAQRFGRWDKVTTVYHEAVPGHHLQAGAVALAPLTRAHRLAFLSGHGEGWALYAERLMDELGWFATPETRLGFLASQAFRAARVVIDIGLHTGRPVPAGLPGAGSPWTPALAQDALARAGGLSPAFARSEVLRYLSWPAQATTYKLGERTWLAGRDDAQRRAGAAFDRRAWHARALSLGALGLDALRDELGRC
ncbi:MAG: DUF885 domain-containing protein [Acidimicrobiales bacterium]